MKRFQQYCFFAVLCLLLVGASGGRADITPGASADWPVWRGDAVRSASTPAALPESLHPLWSRELGAPLPAWPESQHKIRFDASYEPVVAGPLIFVGSMVTDRITAYDTATGQECWRFYTDGPVRFAPLAWRDALYAVSDDGWIYCLEAVTGALRWSKRGAPSTRWVLGNDRLVSAWPVRGAPVLIDEPNGRGTLYVAAGIWPFMGTFIHALDAETGEVRWTNSGSGSVYVLQQHNSPAFAGVAPQGYMTVGGDILLVSGGRTVPAAYNRHTGEFMYFEVANRTYGKDAGGYGVGVMGDRYFNRGCLYALTDGAPVLNLNDKKILPKGVVTRIGEGFVSISANGVALYGSEPISTETTVVDRKGETQHISSVKLPLQQIITTNLSARQAHFRAGNRLFLSGPGGWIGSADLTQPSDENRIWETRIEGEIWTLIPGDGKLFAVTRDGTLHAFGGTAQTGTAPHIAVPSGPQASLPVAGSEGYALVWGLDDAAEEQLVRLASRYHVIGIDPDIVRVQKLRRRLDDAGWYGRRIHLLAGDPANIPFPPYLASQVEIRLSAEQAVDAIQKAWHVLRPYGGYATFQNVSDPFLDAFIQATDDLRDDGAKVVVNRAAGIVLLARPDALPESAPWTHQYADPANSVVSGDERVKPPLGLLWFGGPPNDDILPRHGHGPSPQVVGGRLFIEGPHALRAVDVYTGRLLWQRALPGLGVFYDNTSHQPGANEIGSNYASLEDGVYVVYNRHCLRLDPVTGDTLATFTLPGGSDDEAPQWGYVGVYEDLLIAGGSPLLIQTIKGQDMPKVVLNAPYASSSTQLIVMDRYTGRVLWQREAEQVFRHNAIIAAAGRIYCIDGLSQMNLDLLRRRGEEPKTPATLLALDARTGQTIWQADKDVFGTWLGYSIKHDILIKSGSPARDRAKDEAEEQMAAYGGTDGRPLWRERFKYAGKPMLHDETIYTEGAAFNLFSGKPKRRLNPLTGRPMDWEFARNYGCNTPIGGRHMLLFRSAAAGFYDLSTDGGTGNWGGFKSGCTANLIPADGVLSAPDYTRTCTCSYQNQCSLALVPMPDVEVWTFQAFDKLNGPLRRVAINFGAPGDWPAPDGTLWFEYPMVGGKGPNLGLKLTGETTFYRHHSLEMSGDERPVIASGVEGALELTVPLKNKQEYSHRVRLLFAEPIADKPGERVFDVFLQGEIVLRAFDIVAVAGGYRRTVIREFNNVAADKTIDVELRPSGGSKLPPVLSGIAIDRNEPLQVAFHLLADSIQYINAVPEGTLQGILSVSNRYHQTLDIALSGAIADEPMAEQRLVLQPLEVASVKLAIPVEVVNQGANLSVTLDLGADFGRFRQLTEQISLEAEVPVSVVCTAPAIDQAHVEVSSLLSDRSQNPHLIVLLDDQVVHESTLDLAPGQSHRVACNLSEGLLGRQAMLSVKLRWPTDQCAVPGGFQQKFDFSKLLTVPRRTTDSVAAQPPALTLGRRDGIFPEDRRKRVGTTDDLEAELDWWWDGEALVIHALVSDDHHFNEQRRANIWNGDAMQLALAARNGPLTSVALALTEIGTELWRYAGPDPSLPDRVVAQVTRDETTHKTRYLLRLPLASLDIDARPGTIFRLNVVLLDDDQGDGYRYWRQMTPGLAGGVNPEAYRLFVLGE